MKNDLILRALLLYIFGLKKVMQNQILTSGRSYGKTAAAYTQIIESGQYPSSVNLFQQNEINTMWANNDRMAAIQKLQSLLETPQRSKTLL